MTDKIRTGAFLLAEGTLLPPSMNSSGPGAGQPSEEQYAGESFMPGWHWLKNLDSKELERLISQAGWSFFYLAGGIEMSAFGADRERATNRALKRIITSLQAKNFNCLEITKVTAKSFLGWPYVSISAHSRHVQKGNLLSTD